MQHSLHIFVGDDLSPFADAVNRHLNHHCDNASYSHVAEWRADGSKSIVRLIDDTIGHKHTISNDTEGKKYFEALHPQIVVADPGGDISPDLYVCVYLQLYDEPALKEVFKILDWIKFSGRYYLVDVYGVSEDLASLFCISEADKSNLVYKLDEMKNRAKDACRQIIDKKRSDLLRHFLLIQGCNLNGLGLKLDKDTLIKIFGEYARLSTANFSELFPPEAIERPDVMALGISAYWFDPEFFQEYVYRRGFVDILKRDGVCQHELLPPKAQHLVQKVRNLISWNTPLLSDSSSLPDIYEAVLGELHRAELSLPEKRAFLALLLGENDELVDEHTTLEDMPTIDDCMNEAMQLFISENNKMADAGEEAPLSPDGKGKVCLSLERMKRLRTQMRQSNAYIKKQQIRLKDIEKRIGLVQATQKRLTDEGFVYGDMTFKLAHDVVERPLEETYQPKSTSRQAVDLRKNFSQIRNQGKLGACTSFSMASIFEYILNQGAADKKVCLSPRFLYYGVCQKNADGTIVDNGGSFFSNIQTLGEKGICEENLCPYDDGFKNPPTDEAVNDALTRLVTQAKNVDVTHEALTSALAEGYPVGISLKIFDSFGQGHKGFVFRPTDRELNSTDFGYHAMVICGYSEKEKIYIVRNSWGEGFGEKGYCYIPFSYIEDKDLCRQACIVTGVSCATKAVPVTDTPQFDSTDGDVDYAVTRILIDEEMQQLGRLKKEYDALDKNYKLLLGKLTNPATRNTIKNFATQILPPPPSPPVRESSKKQVKINNWKYWAFGMSILCAVLTAVLIPEIAIKSILFVVFALAAIMFYFVVPTSKEVIEPAIDESVTIPTDNTDYHLTEQFNRAEGIIDRVCDVKDKLSKWHVNLKSYLPHLETMLILEEQEVVKMDEHITPPFYSIFSLNNTNVYSRSSIDGLFNPSWLRNMIDHCADDGLDAAGLKDSLSKSLRQTFGKVASDFSMSKYLLGSTYPYVPDADANMMLNTIMNMSLPFAQTIAGMPRRPRKQLLFCDVDASDQVNWDSLLQSTFTVSPSYHNEKSKVPSVTYIQLQEYDLDETLYEDEACGT